MRTYRLHDASWSRIVTHRVRQPEALTARLTSRRRPDEVVPGDGQLVLLACNHRVDPRSGTPVDRRELLDRIVEAMSVPEVDGVIATADLLEELTLLNVLEHRLAVCSAASKFARRGTDIDAKDQTANHDGVAASTISASNFDAGILSHRWGVAGSQVADDVAGLANQSLLAILELRAEPPVGQTDFDVPWQAWTEQIHASTSSLSTGFGVWITMPAITGLNHVAEATGFPVLLRDTQQPILPTVWRDFFRTELPLTVRGMVAGSSALFPTEGSVGNATTVMAKAVRDRYRS